MCWTFLIEPVFLKKIFYQFVSLLRIEDLLKESDDDEPSPQADARSQLTSKTSKSERSSKRAEKKAANSGNRTGPSSWIRENDNEDPLDLLDPMAIKNVCATKPLTKQQIQAKRDKE